MEKKKPPSPKTRATNKIKEFLLWVHPWKGKQNILYKRINNFKFSLIMSFLQKKNDLVFLSLVDYFQPTLYMPNIYYSLVQETRGLILYWCHTDLDVFIWDTRRRPLVIAMCTPQVFVKAHFTENSGLVVSCLRKTSKQKKTTHLKYFLYKNYAFFKLLLYNIW